MGLDTEESLDAIPHRRIVKCYDAGMQRVQVRFQDAVAKAASRSSLPQVGARRLLGYASRGGLEAILQRVLHGLGS